MRATLLTMMVLLLAARTAAADAAQDLGALLSQLAQPAPTATAFVEQRESPLLEAPLLLRGVLQQPDANTLVREVESPYAERSTIRAERVTVEREGSPPRRFALRQAPELGALLDSFRAVLGGDLALLQRHYRVLLSGNVEAGWQIRLLPHPSRRATRIDAIELSGHSNELRCFALRQADGGGSRMLLGSAAAEAEPDFARHCVRDAE